MTDLDLIIQAAKLGAAGSDNCNQVAAAIERVTAGLARRPSNTKPDSLSNGPLSPAENAQQSY